MKGLVLEIYYKNKKQVCLTNLILCFIWLPMVYLIDSQSMIFIYILMVFSANSLFILLSQRKDYDLKLYKYEKTLPVNFNYVILSKYASQLFMIFISTLVSVFLIYTSMILGRSYFDYGFSDMLTLLSVIIAFILQMSAFFYLTLYTIDFEKGDLWIVLGIIISIALVILEVFTLNNLEISKGLGNMILIFSSVSILLLSYYICSKAYTYGK